MRHVNRWLTGLPCLGLAGLLVGCHQASTPSPAPAASSAERQATQAEPPPETGPFTGGKQVFAVTGCSRCHTINGIRIGSGGPGGRPPGPGGGGPPPEGGPPPHGGPPPEGGPPPQGGPGPRPGGKAPDLGKTGQNIEHTAEWFMEKIRNPKANKPDSKMPSYDEKKINDNDLHALAEFLQGLR